MEPFTKRRFILITESPDRAEDVKEGAVGAGPSPRKHDMEDIAWKTVDTDEEILEKGNGKWINLRITEHQRSSSDEDDDGSNGRFVYVSLFYEVKHLVF